MRVQGTMANVTGALVYDTNRASLPLARQIDEPGGNHTKKIRTAFPSPLVSSSSRPNPCSSASSFRLLNSAFSAARVRFGALMI